MSDAYFEDPQDDQIGALDQLRAELARLKSEVEHRIQASASDVVDETRMLARRAQHKIRSQFGLAALIAVCTGVALGLVAAAILSRSGSDRR